MDAMEKKKSVLEIESTVVESFRAELSPTSRRREKASCWRGLVIVGS
jgi:hypothetical protein